MTFTAKILSLRFRHLNIVGCLLKKRPTKGAVTGTPGPPPPLATPLNQSCSLFGVFVAKQVVSGHVTQNVVEKFACNNRYDFILKVVRQGKLKARYKKIDWYNRVIIKLLVYFRFVSRCYDN